MNNEEYLCLELKEDNGVLTVLLNRPASRNALNLKMIEELEKVFQSIAEDLNIRCLVLRGKGGHFCAGGDVKEMAIARNQPFLESNSLSDPVARLNRRFGDVISALRQAPQTVIVLVQGAAMGGGFGLVCAADFVLADHSASFRLPETTLGLPPAQIAPFLVERLGLIVAKQCALSGARLSAEEAHRKGLVDRLCENEAELKSELDELLCSIQRCAPAASRATKSLLLSVADNKLSASENLDRGAILFAEATRSKEGMEGIMAFMQKRPPSWNQSN